ncbi:MAG TPA: DUF4388 domain-containing protein [Thermoleophilia bacterium]|nr:DUF4388 domain-containing protein [Thermoleophilia bacterium]
MILWGRIQDFSIFSILQFIAAYEKTGILEIQDFEEYGYIYVTRGRVDAISLPLSEDLIGNRLVAAGAITQDNLKECLLSYGHERRNEPLGLILLKRGYTDRATLQEIINQQAFDQSLDLSNWTAGTFKFVVPEHAVKFPITPSIDVQSLLLEASRRLDEGERPRREKVQVEEEVCLTCTSDCSDEIKARYLKNDICLWRNMPTVVRDHAFSRPKEPERDERHELFFP